MLITYYDIMWVYTIQYTLYIMLICYYKLSFNLLVTIIQYSGIIAIAYISATKYTIIRNIILCGIRLASAKYDKRHNFIIRLRLHNNN